MEKRDPDGQQSEEALLKPGVFQMPIKEESFNKSNIFIFVTGTLSVGLGLVVLGGWHTHALNLIQVHPSFLPMQYNGALGFLILGVGLIGLATGVSRLPLASGILSIAIGLLTIVEHLSGLNLVIDQLFMTHYLTFEGSQPGRMPPGTSLCLMLSGIALLIATDTVYVKQRSLILGLMGAIIVPLGTAPLVDYLFGIEDSLGWVKNTHMAFHSAIGFVLIGASVVCLAWMRGRDQEKGVIPWAPFSLAMGVAVISLLLWQSLLAHQVQQTEVAMNSQVMNLKRNISALLRSRILSLVRMARRWEFRDGFPRAEWEADARLQVQTQPGIQAIGWIDTSYRTRWIAPLQGNETAQDFDVSSDRSRRHAMDTARSRRDVVMTHTMDLNQGGIGFELYVPIYLRNEFGGFIVGVFRPEVLLDTLLIEIASLGYWMAVFDDGQEIYSGYLSREHEMEWAREAEIILHNVSWQLKIWPQDVLLNKLLSPLPNVVLVLGSVIAVLLGRIMYLAQTRRFRTEEIAKANRQLKKEVGERKRTQETLASRERLYRTLTETVPHVIWLGEANGHITYQNKAWLDLTGLTREESAGLGWAKALHPKDRPVLLEQYSRASQNGESYRGECRVLSKDNSYRTIEFIGTPVRDDSGTVVNWVGVNTDITERKNAEEALRHAQMELEQKVKERTAELSTSNLLLKQEITERKQAERASRSSQERFAGIMEIANDAIISVDESQRVILFNHGAEKIFGYTAQEVLGQPLDLVIPSRHRIAHRKHIDEFSKSHQPTRPMATRLKIFGLRKNGEEFPAEASISKLDIRGHTIFTVMLRDITDRMKAEEELRKHRDHLEELVEERTLQLKISNKELESFSYSVSHDLRTPLRAIDGFSQALLDDYYDKLDPKADNFLNRIQSAAQRMGELINDLLNLSRLTRREMLLESVDLGALAGAITKELEREHPERKVKFIITDGLITRCDPRLVRIVLENLFGNAWKFSVKQSHPKIEFSSIQNGGKTAYYVRDNGAGFEMAYANKLFGAFQRLHSEKEFKGTGIGLATVQRIIHRHGGRVWAEGETGQGATFYFTLEHQGRD